MASNLGRLMNKTIFVSINGLYDDAICRPYKLVGIELVGLWLQGPGTNESLHRLPK